MSTTSCGGSGWSCGQYDGLLAIRASATPVYKCQLMLYTRRLGRGDESGHPILLAGTVAVSALIVLAGCLPSHFKPEGDLWPSGAQADSMVDEHREFGICLVPREPGTLDPREHLGCRQVSNPLRRVRWVCWCLVPPQRLRLFDSWTGPALRLAHGIQHVA